jgi:Protein of unknown function (DUF1292).
MANDENMNLENSEDDITVELELDDGTSVTCAILTILTVNEKDYIALTPMVDEEDESFGEVWFYEYVEDEANAEAEPELKYIEDDDVYDAVADAFEEFLDSTEYDELLTDEDDDGQ